MTVERPISFDLSLNSTGVWLPDGVGQVVKGLDHKHPDQQRHNFLLERFCELLEWYEPDAIFKEAIFVHPRRLNGSVQLLQVHGLLTAAAYLHGQLPIYDVGPTQLKNFITGSGKASKEEMYEAAVGLGYEGENQSDIVDAWCVHHFFRANGV